VLVTAPGSVPASPAVLMATRSPWDARRDTYVALSTWQAGAFTLLSRARQLATTLRRLVLPHRHMAVWFGHGLREAGPR